MNPILRSPKRLTHFAAPLALVVSAPAAAEQTTPATVLFSASFDDMPDGSPPAPWEALTGKWEVREGRLRAEGDGMIILQGKEFADFAIECTIRFEQVKEPSRWLSLMYRVQPEGKPPYAQFAVRQGSTAPNGLECAVRTARGKWSIRSARAATAPGTPLGKDQRLRVEACGGHVRQFLNGTPVAQGHLLFGCTGNAVGLQTNGVTATFDNFTVTELTDMQRVASAPTTRRPLIVAHRGASDYAPENTLAAVRLAMEMGADGVEHDVCVTRDGVPVLMHDYTLDRTTTGKGKVADHDLADLRQMKITGPHGDDYPDEPIPTLEEALLAMKGKTMPVIEVKEAHTAEPIVEVIRKVDMVDEVVIISFKDQLLADVAKLEPRLPTAWLIGGGVKGEPREFALSLLHRARACGANCVNMSAALATPEVVALLHSRGMSAWVWTVNDPDHMRHLIEIGIDAITTNCPDVLGEVLNGLGKDTTEEP